MPRSVYPGYMHLYSMHNLVYSCASPHPHPQVHEQDAIDEYGGALETAKGDEDAHTCTRTHIVEHTYNRHIRYTHRSMNKALDEYEGALEASKGDEATLQDANKQFKEQAVVRTQ